MNTLEHKGLRGGIGALYLQEQLLHKLGLPLNNEVRFDRVLRGKGQGYDLLVGLPIGADQVRSEESPICVFALHPDNRFQDFHEFPSYKYSSKIALILESISTFFGENKNKAWFWWLTGVSGTLTAYLGSMMLLIMSAWQKGSTLFSRSWLINQVSKPLMITPAVSGWTLFLGYKKRLAKIKPIDQASKDYFGLPAEDPNGSIELPDPTGEALHERIAAALGAQRPVFIIGSGGAGKTTLLARWASLALSRKLPRSVGKIQPVFITPGYYSGNLVKAVADTLRERDGVAVEEETMRAQLQTGKFLILFDGVSEVDSDKEECLREIFRTTLHSEFKSCRFLISSRPLKEMPSDAATFILQPLTADAISFFLPRYKLGMSRERQVRRQLQSFGKRAIEPLLFSMIVAQSNDGEVSTTRSQLYERYFRRLLRAESGGLVWYGWQKALETLANWFLLSTGSRGLGLPHETLLERIDSTTDREPPPSLIVRLRERYGLAVNNALNLVQILEAAGILTGGRRWRFAHDTFEEYFAASYLVSYLEESGEWPLLDKWTGFPEREREFVDIIDFVSEIASQEILQHLLSLSLPTLWKQRLLLKRPE